MNYSYGSFTDEQIQVNERLMHAEVHKLLLYKDKNINQKIFDSEHDFYCYFNNLLYRFAGLNELLFCPVQMVGLMATLQSAYDMVCGDSFNYCEYRRLILDAHTYIKDIFSAESEGEKCHH